ncbi:EAL domain-containing protein [Alteromonadaceae bacterium M269]|nr:EAL domain-containing protein [Alteromonadaceae bacterium M269]
MHSLRNRILQIMLLLLVTIVVVTLVTVRSSSLKHSTGQVLGYAHTSAKVVEDYIFNRATNIYTALQTTTKDFSVKSLIKTGKDDQASLSSALQSHQRRAGADIIWVLDGQGRFITSTSDQMYDQFFLSPVDYQDPGIRFIKLGNEYYLIGAAPVKFVERSTNINAWVLMGIEANKIINEQLVELTDMQLSLFYPTDNNLEIVSSSLSDDLQTMLSQSSLNFEDDLHDLTLEGQKYVYLTQPLGLYYDAQMQLALVTPREKAYVSYYDQLGQLIGIILIAALMAFITAWILSKRISDPITTIVNVANKISGGEYVDKEMPKASITEVSSLSEAVWDMQDSIKKREEEVHTLAYFDELTGLPNRLQFIEKLKEMTDTHSHCDVAVIIINLDRFQDINDTLGHAMGDKLLVAVAERLGTFLDDNSFFARLGGDEYAFIVRGDELDSQELAETIAALFKEQFKIDAIELDVYASIGLAIYPKDADDISKLMQCADIALHNCKGDHKAYAIYNAAMNKHSVQRLNLTSELRGSLAAGQLELHYQPKLSLRNNEVETVECLIRWTHPVHGFIPPDDFIPLAEQTGAIRDVTHFALTEALKQQHAWRQKGWNIGMAVNISAIDLIDMQLPVYVEKLLAEYDVDPTRLTLEVTESAVMTDPESALKALNKLHGMGIIISIDDFGTGYSSMAQLKKMPVAELKIDKAFVLELASSKDDQVMVKTLVALAKNLSLQTVAEGVEDETTLEFLTSIGCTKAQGFHMSRPLPSAKFDIWHQEFLDKKQTEQSA